MYLLTEIPSPLEGEVVVTPEISEPSITTNPVPEKKRKKVAPKKEKD